MEQDQFARAQHATAHPARNRAQHLRVAITRGHARRTALPRRPLPPPVFAAEQIGSLAAFAPEPVTLVLGSGDVSAAFVAFGIIKSSRGWRIEEQVQVPSPAARRAECALVGGTARRARDPGPHPRRAPSTGRLRPRRLTRPPSPLQVPLPGEDYTTA
jgi:hypothetical protein